MSWCKLGVMAALCCVCASFLLVNKDAIACELVPFSSLSGFSEISPNIYTDDSLTPDEQQALLAAIRLAKQRVSQVYGPPQSSPTIISSSHRHYADFGFNPTGMQRSGFGQECIFIGPKGQNVDVIAHEMVHAEVRDRLSFYVEFTQLPAWFMEGVAVKVDYRAPLLLENIDLEPQQIVEIKQVFFLHDFSNTDVAAYQAARVAVEPMSPGDLYQGLARMEQGEVFEQVFARLHP